jgi:hypothetical protein
MDIRRYLKRPRDRPRDDFATGSRSKKTKTEDKPACQTDATIYCWKFAPPFAHCLSGICYFGQTVKTLQQRTRQHKADSLRDPKETGLHCLWRLFPHDDHWIISQVDRRQFDTREEAQDWMNELEKNLIAKNGGIMRSMDRRCKQTLNLQSGGQGDARKIWEGIRAHSRKKLMKVWPAFKQFHERETHLRVRADHTETVDGTVENLGNTVHHIRSMKTFMQFDDFRQWLDDRAFVWDEYRAHLDLDVWPAFKQFYQRETHLRVRQNHTETVNGTKVNLGNTVGNIRSKKTFMQFDDFRQWLEDRAFVWDEYRAHLDLDVWPAFKQFYQRETHLRVHQNHTETVNGTKVNLGFTVSNIRSKRIFMHFDDFRQWLYERKFQMHARNKTENDRRWAAVNSLLNKDCRLL